MRVPDIEFSRVGIGYVSLCILVRISSETKPLASPIEIILASRSSKFVNSLPHFLFEISRTPMQRLSSLIGKAIRLIEKTPSLESKFAQSFL